MMSDKARFWFAALAGVLVTIGLLYVLLGQPGTSVLTEPPAREKPEEALSPRPPEVAGQASAEKLRPVSTIVEKQPEPEKPSPKKPEVAPKPEPVVPKKTTEAAEEVTEQAAGAALPELNLSEAEIQALSPEERERYERLLQSYQTVRNRMSQLNQEKVRLQHRIENMSERNEQMEGELKELREGLKE